MLGKRIVAGLFEVLAYVKFAVKNDIKTHGLLLRYAILKAAYTGPDDKVVGKATVFIGKTDADVLAKKELTAAVVAEEVLAKCRSIAIGLGSSLNNNQLAKAYTMLDVNVVRVLSNKQQTSAVKYTSIEHVASDFCKELQNMVGSPVENPWATSPATEAPAQKAQTKVAGGMRTFTAVGALVNEDASAALAAAGFSIGMAVVMKADKSYERYKLTAVVGQSVELTDGHTNTKHVYTLETFVAFWKQYPEEFYSSADNHTSKANRM